MTDLVAEIKALVAEAVAEAKAMSDSLCNTRGKLWWKKSERQWQHWRKELVKTQRDEIVSYMFVRGRDRAVQGAVR